MPNPIEAARQARAIVCQSTGPFCATTLAATLARAHPKIAAMIPAAAAVECVALPDGRFILPVA